MANEALEKEAVQRLGACRRLKAQWELDFRECYFFASPHRMRTVSSNSSSSSQNRMQDAPELNTDEAFILAQDFVTEIANAFMPEAKPWCERGPGIDTQPNEWRRIQSKVEAADRQIFDAMKASNLYPEVAKAFYPDLAIGTVGLWVQRPTPSSPIVNSAIPLRELEINLGPYGEIDDRFAVRFTRNCYVRELVGEDVWAKMDERLKQVIGDKPDQRTQVVWGFWRKWAEKGDEVWQHVMLHGNSLIHDSEIRGEGCCPLLVMRFNPSSDWPFGLGPLIQGLPSLRQIDEFEAMMQKNAELSLTPPLTYPNDSFAAVEQGFEPGMAYPIQPGSENAVKSIYTVPPADRAHYAYEDKLKKLRKLFFVDLPEQSGDTPPTLGQWLDEMARAQRRLGTPGLPFWREGPAQIFTRFKYLLEAAGTIEKLELEGKAVATLPRNPAQAAAETQELAEAARTAQILGGMFPEGWKMRVDDGETMKKFIEKARVQSILVMRDPGAVNQAVEQMAQLVKGQAPGAPDVAPAP